MELYVADFKAVRYPSKCNNNESNVWTNIVLI